MTDKRSRRRREREHRYNQRRAHTHGHGTWSGRAASDYGVTPGWAPTSDELEEAKRLTHDTLISLMGESRDGPVSWIIRQGTAALKLIDESTSSPDTRPMRGTDQDGWNDIRRMLIDHGGYLCVAFAPGRPK